MEIWDVYSLKLVGTCKSHSAVSCRWAPDGRKILTGVLNPRLRVSNNYKVFKYNGELLNHADFSQSELYEVLWRPGGKYQDRPASPPRQNGKSENSEKNGEVENGQKPPAKTGEKKVFRPKGEGTFAAQLKAAKSALSGGRHLSPDETFGNDEDTQDKGEKKPEEAEKEKEKKEAEQAKKVTTKILRRNDKKEEENKNVKEKENGLDGIDAKKDSR